MALIKINRERGILHKDLLFQENRKGRVFRLYVKGPARENRFKAKFRYH